MAEITLTAETGRPTGSSRVAPPPRRRQGPGRRLRPRQRPGVRRRRLARAAPRAHHRGRPQRPDRPRGRRRARTSPSSRTLQRHPVRRTVDHVDFLRVDRDESITVDVPIVLVGEAKQVDQRRRHRRAAAARHLTRHGPPGRDPDRARRRHLRASTIGDAIRVGDLDPARRRHHRGRPATSRRHRQRSPARPIGRRGRAAEARSAAEGEALPRARRPSAGGRRTTAELRRSTPRATARARRPTCWSSASATPAPSTRGTRHNVGADVVELLADAPRRPAQARARSGRWSPRSASAAGGWRWPSRRPT